MLKDDPDCPDLICCSVYDLKPVYLMSTVAECIEWDEKTRNLVDGAGISCRDEISSSQFY